MEARSRAGISLPHALNSGRRLDRSSVLTQVACAGVMALILAAPFEALRPLLQVPGQSFTTVETVLLGVIGLCIVAAAATGVRPSLTMRDLLPWSVLTVAAVTSAALAPEFRGNALHMAARFALAATVWAVCVVGATFASARQRVVLAVVASGSIVGVLVLADFAGVAGVDSLFVALPPERGKRRRAGARDGPVSVPDDRVDVPRSGLCHGPRCSRVTRARRAVGQVALLALLAIMAEAIVLTFTRAGLLTVALSLAIVGVLYWRDRGFDHAMKAVVVLVAIVAVQLLSSGQPRCWRLRLTTEGQGHWFSAVIEGPSSVTVDTMTPTDVPLTVTNTGRATWDSDAAEPVRLSYHWVADDPTR